MSNILKVTTPINNYENTANRPNVSQQTEDINIKNPVDPQRVVRPDGRTDANSEQDRQISYESNFGNFVQSLRDVPRLREIMTKMIFGGMANLVEAGIGKGTADEIANLFQMLEMNPEELNAFLKSQMSGANRLQGALFDMLRQVMDEATSVELKAGVLDFLKKYNDMSSGKHILQNIQTNLKEIDMYMFRNNREELKQLVSKLLPYGFENNEKNPVKWDAEPV